MNLHLHLHLKDTILDFGPSRAFWCFPFERYNGILGSYTTNNKKVEVQFMRKFITTQAVNEVSRACATAVIITPKEEGSHYRSVNV